MRPPFSVFTPVEALMKRRKQRELNAAEVREIAATAICDPRTVVRFLAGESVQGTSHMRITRAIEQLGHAADGDRPARRAAR
jgi:hypothetical protein